MPPIDFVVRPLESYDRPAWLDMWAQYCAFYAVVIARQTTEATWVRLTADADEVRGLIAVRAGSGEALGFANYVVHPFTWSERPACYLEDLFVVPHSRGGGVGRALMQRLFALGRSAGWSRVYWMTQAGNTTARHLYDRFASADDFVRYTVTLDGVREG